MNKSGVIKDLRVCIPDGAITETADRMIVNDSFDENDYRKSLFDE